MEPSAIDGIDFAASARHQNAKKDLLVTDRALTYGEVEQRIRKLTAYLSEACGMAEGCRVVLSSHDDAALVVLFLALLRNGITAVIVDPQSTHAEAAGIVARADPDGIIADADLWRDWDLEPQAKSLSVALRIATAPVNQNTLFSKLLGKPAANKDCYPGLLDGLKERNPPATIQPDTIAYILFTSGTTSLPKGVEISAGALNAHLNTLSRQFSYSAHARILNVLPLSHADGLNQGPLIAYVNGGTAYRPGRFSAQTMVDVLDTIYRQRITHMVAVPTMLAMMLKLDDQLSELFAGEDFQFIISAAAHLEKTLWVEIERLTRRHVANLYGLTETVNGSLFSGPDDLTRRVGTLGKPVDCDVRLIDDDGDDVAGDASGEVLISGAHLMSGYFRDPQATAETLRDGWLHTGDLARRDTDGFYHYVGRKKNIIISGGLNIIPEQLCAVLLDHPDVAEAVAVGVQEPEWGEVAAACVVAKDGATVDVAALIGFCRDRLSAYKVPHRIVVSQNLPKGRTGKVMLDAVRAMLAEDEDWHAVKGSVKHQVIEVAAHVFQTTADSLSPASDTANTAGWDSLGHMQLIAALETQFDINMSTRDIISITTLSDAIGAVERCKHSQ